MNGHSQTNSGTPVSDQSFQVLMGIMEQIFPLSKEFKEALRLVLFETTYKKGSTVLATGAKQQRVMFLLDGLFREISVNKDSDTFAQKTTWFWFNFAFIYTIPGFFDQEPAQVNIKATRNSNVIFINYDDWKSLKDNFSETDKVTEKVRTEHEMARKQHTNDIISLNTTDRYLKRESELDILFPHIQLQYIGEYMGMSAGTLGKLRSKFTLKKTGLD